MKRISFLKGALLGLLLFAGGSTGIAMAQNVPFKVGVTPGPHAQILEVVKQVAAKDGLDVQIIEFTNYVLPNQALDRGELNANSFQHKPYLDNQVQAQGLKLVVAAQSIAFPMGIYANKVTDIRQIPNGARIAIPNDPSNGARALLLLQAAGVIELKPNFSVSGSVQDVAKNPHQIKFVEVDAAMLPRTLAEVDLAVIPTNYALDAGFNPKKDALFLEPVNSPYTGIIAVRAADKDSAAVAKFVRAYHSPEVKAFIEKQFNGAILPTW